MAQPLTEEQLRQAMETCASEPVHIPGSIQPMGYLLACDFQEGVVRQASENCSELFGKDINKILGQTVPSLLGTQIWHNLNNIRAQGTFAAARQFVGTWHAKDDEYAIHVSKGGDRFVVEVEKMEPTEVTATDTAQQQALLISQIEGCTTQEQLFETTSNLLRHLSKFDRVTVIEFDAEWNGKVVAEARSRLLDPLLGLRFPAQDFPAQARDLMRKTPIRLISDVGQTPIPLVALSEDEQPLDMTFANNRGVSPVHMQYLHNFKIGATMTLSVTLGSELWGIISFHSTKPRVASPEIRRLLLGFLPIFRLKLDLIRRDTALQLSRQIDQLQTDVQTELEMGSELDAMMQHVGPSIIDGLDAVGVVMTNGSDFYNFGVVPDAAVIATLSQKASAHPNNVLISDNLAGEFPELEPHLKGLGGVLVITYEETRSLLVFRNEVKQAIAWAGNPTKTVELLDGNMQIEPRGVFSRYLEDVAGKSKAWSRDDVHLMRQLWPLLSAAERRAFLTDMNRHQTLMINELNHRVRNILALVKSVSTQARRTGGSLESYSNALEARIHALAAAHEIGAGSAQTSVSITEIVRLEAEPYTENGALRVILTGESFSVRAESAPIFALVIHELMTNAVKYGALSVPGGHVDIDVQGVEDGVQLTWSEQNGPITKAPDRQGFGTTLIKQAVPYEMGGTAALNFTDTGVVAVLNLPTTALGDIRSASAPKAAISPEQPKLVVPKLRNGLIMLVEDNFMIANDTRTQLEGLGFVNIEMLSGVKPALEFLGETTPTLAILDVNLGLGETSEPIASELLYRKVPMIFVTGYGEKNGLPPHLNAVPILTKPVTIPDLLRTIDGLIF